MAQYRTRLMKELQELRTDASTVSCGIKAYALDEADLTRLRAQIAGPRDSPYESGVFELDIKIPPGYPFTPPTVKFVTKVWHPNISSQTGVICLDILKDAWAAAMTLRTVLLSIQALLASPEPNDPQDAHVASQYKKSREEFDQHARYWTQMYASGGLDGGIKQIMEMGFDMETAQKALERTGGNVEAALDQLLS